MNLIDFKAKSILIKIKVEKDFEWDKEWYKLKNGAYFKGTLKENIPH